jgi:hypothetical protein
MKKISEPKNRNIDNNILENIFCILKTQEKANELLGFVDVVRAETFGTRNFDIESAGSKKFGDKKPDWFEAIKSKFLKGENLDSTRESLEELEKNIREAETVKIEIAFKPSEEFVEEAYDLIKSSKRFKKIGNFLLNIEINGELEGGARFSIGGDYLDITLKKVVLNYLETNDAINRYL